MDNKRDRLVGDSQWRVALAVWLLGAVLLAPASHGQIVVVDDMQQTVKLDQPAQRIVSLSPHITENLFAIGAGDSIVATVMYADYPPEASLIPVIGAFNSVSYETLLSLQPDLVIAWASGNGEEVAARIQSLGLTLYQDEPRSLDDIPSSLRRLGQLTGRQEQAGAVAQAMQGRLTELRKRYAGAEPVRTFYQIWNEPLTTLSGDHLVSDIIELCGGQNIFADAIPIAPVVSEESVLQANPRLIVASGEDASRPVWLDDWKRWPSLSAVSGEHLYWISPDLLQRSSPRVMEGVEQLCQFTERARQTQTH